MQRLKRFVGLALHSTIETVLSWRHTPLTRYFPRGISWPYDVQRFSGTRKLEVIFDVGANIGQTVERLLRYFPQSQIYSFEPGAKSFETLQRRFGGRAGVHLHGIAMGATRGTAALQINDNTELNTLVGTVNSANSVAVEVTTLDAFTAAAGISHIDVLKVDVEGWELEVLKGADGLIAANNVVFVLAEAAFSAGEQSMQQFSTLHVEMEKRGFVLCGFYELNRYGPRNEFVLFSNVLYVHPAARLKWGRLGEEWAGWMALQKPKWQGQRATAAVRDGGA